MILKLLLVIAVIAIVYFMFIKPKKVSSKQQHKHNDANEMVQCEKCDVYVELQDAILSGSRYYCSTECLEASK